MERAHPVWGLSVTPSPAQIMGYDWDGIVLAQGAPVQYVTQGTVQVSLSATRTTVVINPVPEYSVKHRSNDYVVFVEDPAKGKTSLKSQIFPISESYEVKDTGLAGALATAAAGRARIEVQIEITGRLKTVV